MATDRNLDLGRLFGRGMSFPPRLGPDGRFAVSEGPENVRESIRVLLTTELGERLMLPELGAGLGRYLFEPNSAPTHRLIVEAITTTLGRFEPRVDLRGVEVEAAADDPGAAIATLRYRLVATQTAGELSLRIPLAR